MRSIGWMFLGGVALVGCTALGCGQGSGDDAQSGNDSGARSESAFSPNDNDTGADSRSVDSARDAREDSSAPRDAFTDSADSADSDGSISSGDTSISVDTSTPGDTSIDVAVDSTTSDSTDASSTDSGVDTSVDTTPPVDATVGPGAWSATMPPPCIFHQQPYSWWTGTDVLVWDGVAGSGSLYDPSTDTWRVISTMIHFEDSGAAWGNGQMFEFGGFYYDSSIGTDVVGRAYLYDPITDAWKKTSETGMPTSVSFPIVGWAGDRFIVFGGFDDAQYDPVKDVWTPLPEIGAPSTPRQGAITVWTGSELLVWGGRNGSGDLADGGLFSPSTLTWRRMSTAGAPSPREGFAWAWTGSQFVVWGGVGYLGPSYGRLPLSDGAAYSPATDTWTPLSSSGLSARRGVTGTWTGAEFIVFGGVDGDYGKGERTRDGARWNPSSNTWQLLAPYDLTPVGSAPYGFAYGISTWTGSEMVVADGTEDPGSGCTGPSYGGAWHP